MERCSERTHNVHADVVEGSGRRRGMNRGRSRRSTCKLGSLAGVAGADNMVAITQKRWPPEAIGELVEEARSSLMSAEKW